MRSVSICRFGYYLESALRKKCLYFELFWSAFSQIRTEYGETRVSLRTQSKCGKMQRRISPNKDTFLRSAVGYYTTTK